MRRKLPENGCLKEHKEAFWKYLQSLNYREISLKNYKWALKRLEHFMEQQGIIEYSQEIGKAFLEHESANGNHSPELMTRFRLAVRRFNEYLFADEYNLRALESDRTCPEQFFKCFNEYIVSLNTRNLRERTVEKHRYHILKALKKLDSAGIKSLANISPTDIYRVFEQTKDKTIISPEMRNFFKYLRDADVLLNNLSPFVPAVRKVKPVPSVFTKDEINTFLSSFDTDTRTGKRDYAIVLLALRLGMRSGDIAKLKISDVDFHTNTISFIQEKALIPQRLELLSEIRCAIDSYLTGGRQKSKLPNLFLSINSPYRPITTPTIRAITDSHWNISGIEVGERKRGAHSLRMTFASELVSEQVPYDVVRKLLGHEEPSAIKHYVKFDIEQLRACAIEVPPITGEFAKFMAARIECVL